MGPQWPRGTIFFGLVLCLLVGWRGQGLDCLFLKGFFARHRAVAGVLRLFAWLIQFCPLWLVSFVFLCAIAWGRCPGRRVSGGGRVGWACWVSWGLGDVGISAAG
jgi:hypothetical protein